MSLKNIPIPDLGDVSDVEVIEVLVAVGDTLAEDDPVLTLESAKASMDVPCPTAGVIKAIHINVGDKVNSGDPMLDIEASGIETGGDEPAETKAETDAETTSEPAAEPEAAPTAEAISNPTHKADAPLYASPAVRRIATEHDVDLASVAGSGPHGRITKADIQNHLGIANGDSSPAPSTNQPSTNAGSRSQQGQVAAEALSRINKLSATHLHNSWSNIPHVTHFDEADITDLEDWRLALKQQRSEPRLSLLPFMMKAVVHCMQQQPRFNCQLSDDKQQLLYRQYYNLGIAVDTPNGLVVPVINDIDKKGVWDLAAELAETAKRARNGQLKASDMQDGCFTISNLGGVGGQHFTPIINAPEVAILGLGQARWQLRRQGPARSDATIADRLIQPLAVSYDHRVIDGAVAARFIQALKSNLEDIRHLLL